MSKLGFGEVILVVATKEVRQDVFNEFGYCAISQTVVVVDNDIPPTISREDQIPGQIYFLFDQGEI